TCDRRPSVSEVHLVAAPAVRAERLLGAVYPEGELVGAELHPGVGVDHGLDQLPFLYLGARVTDPRRLRLCSDAMTCGAPARSLPRTWEPATCTPIEGWSRRCS